MAENKTIQDKDLDMPCKHKNHTSLKHIGLKLACQGSSCKRPFSNKTLSTTVSTQKTRPDMTEKLGLKELIQQKLRHWSTVG